MAGYVPRWQYPRRRPLERSARARLHLAVAFLLLFIGLILTDVDVQGFQASRGDGTLGTYTVTRITGNDEVHGTFISANRQVVIKNMGYNGNPRVSVGTRLKAIKPSWSWLGVGGESAYGPGRNSADTAWLVFGGLMALVGLVYLIWATRYLIRARENVIGFIRERRTPRDYLAVRAGVPVPVVAARLGHADPSVTCAYMPT